MELPHPGLSSYLDAFNHLSPDRAIHGMGAPGFIPLTSIKAYCDMFGIDGEEEREEFLTFIRALDDEYLTFHAEEAKEREEDEKRNPTPQARKGKR